MKASYPVELAEYVVTNSINYEPAFNWWIKDTLGTQDRIISRMERCSVYVTATGRGGSKKKY